MADQPVVVEKSSSGPIVAIVAIVVIAILAYLAYQYFGAPQTNTTNVNVPTPQVNVQTPSSGQ
ncbi:MAG: hypothetical protein WAW60_02200 [Candidatus Saccharimonadales bacterium]